ncbi:MAG TPA: hypothetical protein VER04_02905 [Polyangiaceae bacterium]|nr:hypothetical protein [Polyangiaceae bacterium]
MVVRRETSRFGVLGALLLLAAACGSSKSSDEPLRPAPIDANEGGAPAAVEPTAGMTNESSGASDGEVDEPGAPDPLNPIGEPCNGRDTYCGLPYDQICFAATHDSAANSPTYWEVPVQDRTILEQLRDGIRALSLSLFDEQGTPTVCRVSCEQGNTALAVVLADVAQFLDENPREVVSLLIDGDVPAANIAAEFAAKGLDERSLVQSPDDDWPTLGAMIDAGTRLVVFAKTPDEGPAWLLPRQTFLWETARDWSSLAAMSCNPAVGTRAQPLYVVHQNLVTAGEDDAAPNAELAAQANALDVVAARLEKCRDQYSHAPNFVAVDFSSEGAVLDATLAINGDQAR